MLRIMWVLMQHGVRAGEKKLVFFFMYIFNTMLLITFWRYHKITKEKIKLVYTNSFVYCISYMFVPVICIHIPTVNCYTLSGLVKKTRVFFFFVHNMMLLTTFWREVNYKN